MKVKKVNRYWCEFCGKASCSGGHMKKHEERCTKNPNRKCGVCKLIDQEQPSLPELIAVLPDPAPYLNVDGEMSFYDGKLQEECNRLLPSLRHAAGECPACMLAAIRQRGIPVPLVSEFSFSKMMKAIWDDINEARIENPCL